MERSYIWEFPVRVTHWLNVLSILILSITGLYIGAPFLQSGSDQMPVMAFMRFLHFTSAYVFTVSVLVRIYWWFMGNKYSKWDQFVPVSAERWKNTVDTGLFYAFLKKDLPHAPGHTGLAGLSYAALFGLFLLEVLTGFALYSQSHVGAFWTVMGGWLLNVMSAGMARLIHHLIMWVIWVFVIFHVYISWHNDRIERNALMSSIFSGYKYMDDHH